MSKLRTVHVLTSKLAHNYSASVNASLPRAKLASYFAEVVDTEKGWHVVGISASEPKTRGVTVRTEAGSVNQRAHDLGCTVVKCDFYRVLYNRDGDFLARGGYGELSAALTSYQVALHQENNLK